MSKFGWVCCTIMFIAFCANLTIACLTINWATVAKDRSIEIHAVGENTTINSYPVMSSDSAKALRNIEQVLGIAP